MINAINKAFFILGKKNDHECVLYYKTLCIYCLSSRVCFFEKKKIEDDETN